MTKTDTGDARGVCVVLAKWHDKISIGAILSLYWFLFWLLNGFDKFFNADHFYGVNFKNALGGFERTVQSETGPKVEEVPGMLEKLNLDTSLAAPLAIIVGIIEVVLGLLFLVALVRFLQKAPHRYEVATACISLSVLFFALLTAGAILLGERGHIQTQGLFIGVLLVSALTLHVSKKASA